MGGKRQGGKGVKSREGKLRAAATAQQGRAEDLLGQMRGAWEEAKKRRLLKPPLPKMPPSTLPPFGKWEVTVGHQEELLHGVVFAGHPWGSEVYDLAATAVSRSCTQKLRDGGVSVRMHTAPDSCNRHNCMYVAVKIILWHMSHPVSVWDSPPALSHFAMWGRQCRELLDKTLAWAQVKGNWKCRRTGWGPEALKEMKEVSGQFAPVGGGKGPVPFAPLSGNMVPIVVLFCIANPDSGPAIHGVGKGKGKGKGGVKGGGDSDSSDSAPKIAVGKGKGKEKGKGKGKGKGGVKGGGDSDSSDSAPEIAVGKGKGKEKGKGKGRGKGKGKEEVVVSDSESSDSDVPISSTGLRRGQVAPESSDSDS